MRIGILGTGDVGQALGLGFANLGYEVKIGSRDPKSEKIKSWIAKSGKYASAGTFAEAAAFAEIAVLATSWAGTENAIRLTDPNHLAGKIVIDATNPLSFKPNSPPSLALGHNDSGGEQVQRWLPKSYVVKAFNIVGNCAYGQAKFPWRPSRHVRLW